MHLGVHQIHGDLTPHAKRHIFAAVFLKRKKGGTILAGTNAGIRSLQYDIVLSNNSIVKFRFNYQ